MAKKKKRKPSGTRPKPHLPPPPIDLPDRRAIEESLHDLLRTHQGRTTTDTPLDRAQAVLYQAFREKNPARRVQLAHEALAISPDCADAYVLLAEHSHGVRRTLRYYEQGVEAAQRALGPKPFEESVGHFWGVLETRPYMRARLGLATSLWSAGRHKEAVAHLQDMLRLNPKDNQGIRYTLAAYLLFLDRDDDLDRLLQQFPDEGSASWAYTRALLTFRRQGDTIDARRLLKLARKANSHVPAYLLSEEPLPVEQPNYYSPGQESEAIVYARDFLVNWKSTPGAIAWLRSHVKGKIQAEPSPARGPLGFIKKWLRDHLPQELDVWEVDCRQLPSWLHNDGQPIRPWFVLVTSQTTHLVLGHEMPAEAPSAALLWDVLVKAMQHPAAEEAHRPTEIRVRADPRWESLTGHLDEIGIALVVDENLDYFDTVFEDMCSHTCGERKPGLLDMPGITPQQVGALYEAAAEFWRQTPWKKVGSEAAIKIECDRFRSGPWYAVIMGQLGMTMGLAVYEKLEPLQRMWAHEDDDASARETVGTSVLFGEAWEIPLPDLDAATKFGWEVAQPDAYPSLVHKDRGISMRLPLAWEVELMEACLRGVADFVNRRRQDDTTVEELSVKASSGPLTMRLSWVSEVE